MIRAYVDNWDFGRQIRLAIIDQRENGSFLLTPVSGTNWRESVIKEGDAVAPSLTLPDDVGRSLLEALASHYGGLESTQTLRKDYEREKIRVDKMLEGYIEIAKKSRQ